MESIFSNSHRIDDLKTAKDEITFGMHPILAMAHVLNRPIDQSPYQLRNTDFKTYQSQTDAIINKFVFPDPVLLIGLCLYLGVHPADLVPEELHDQGTPSPRSVVKACMSIAEDQRLPACDRERAEDFIDFETSIILDISEKNETLWQFMSRLDIVEPPVGGVEMIWGAHTKRPHIRRAQNSKALLTSLFGERTVLGTTHPESYPKTPTIDAYTSAMEQDKTTIRTTWRQANAMKQRTSHHRQAMQKLADKIFGPTHANEATAKTLLFLRGFQPDQTVSPHILSVFIGQQKSTSHQSAKDMGYENEESMCRHWFACCRRYMGVIDKFNENDTIARGMAAQYRDLYSPTFTNAHALDNAIDAYANHKIIETKRHKPPHMDDLLKIYGIKTIPAQDTIKAPRL